MVFQILIVIGCALLGYLFGSIPNGLIISKVFFHKDPRTMGSGNIGGTNVGRTVNKKAGIITIILDMLKMIIPFVTLFILFTYCDPIRNYMLGEDQTYNAFGQGNTLCELCYYLFAVTCLLGHAHSIFVKFKGGKIVATFCGIAIATMWPSFPCFAPVWFIVRKKTKYVSLSSIVLAMCPFIYTWIVYIIYIFFGQGVAGWMLLSPWGPHACIYLPLLFTFGFIYLVIRHKENIKRLMAGTENKVK